MANKDILIVQAQATGAPKQIVVTPVAGRVLQFGPTGDPEVGLKAANQIGFFDNFNDTTRYTEGAMITDGVSLPVVGAAWAWKPNDDLAKKMMVSNGGLRPLPNGGGYLSSSATPVDPTDFSYGFEFTREPTQYTAGSAEGLTVTVGADPLVQPSTHNAHGRCHINISPLGIQSIGWFNTGANVALDAGTDVATITSQGSYPIDAIETGDTVAFSGTLPAELSSSVTYYAIKLTSSTFKVATSRANAIAGTAINLSGAGSGVTVTRTLECLNRAYSLGYNAFSPLMGATMLFQGSNSGDSLTLKTSNPFVAGNAVTVEGTGLVEGTVYYVVNSSDLSLQLAATPGGTPIVLSSDGSADQLLRGAILEQSESAIPLNKRSLLIVRVNGDILSLTMHGLGTVEYYYRGMASRFGSTVGFYWQSNPPKSSTTNFNGTWALHAAWIDAPVIEANYVAQWNTYTSSGGINKIGGRLTLSNNPRRTSSMLANLLGSYDWSVVATGGDVADATNSKLKAKGRNLFTEGVYAFNPTFPAAGASLLHIAPGSVNCSQNSTTANTVTGSEASIKTFESTMPLETGDIETVTICGYLTGTNAKQIKLSYHIFGGAVFDSNASGTPLNAIATPFKIVIERKQTAAVSHITYTTMYVNGTIIGPQRNSTNLSVDFRYYTFLVNAADAGAVTVETILRTVHRLTPR